MKLWMIFIFGFLQIHYITGLESIIIDQKIVSCIPEINPPLTILEQYAEIQVITDLVHRPLRDIAKRRIVVENNGNYNRFLTCSWQRYDFQNKRGEIIFNTVERLLGDSMTREVGATGPGTNLSRVQAKIIIDNCRNATGFTPGQSVVQVQNCILRQIKPLQNL